MYCLSLCFTASQCVCFTASHCVFTAFPRVFTALTPRVCFTAFQCLTRRLSAALNRRSESSRTVRSPTSSSRAGGETIITRHCLFLAASLPFVSDTTACLVVVCQVGGDPGLARHRPEEAGRLERDGLVGQQRRERRGRCARDGMWLAQPLVH